MCRKLFYLLTHVFSLRCFDSECGVYLLLLLVAIYRQAYVRCRAPFLDQKQKKLVFRIGFVSEKRSIHVLVFLFPKLCWKPSLTSCMTWHLKDLTLEDAEAFKKPKIIILFTDLEICLVATSVQASPCSYTFFHGANMLHSR